MKQMYLQCLIKKDNSIKKQWNKDKIKVLNINSQQSQTLPLNLKLGTILLQTEICYFLSLKTIMKLKKMIHN